MSLNEDFGATELEVKLLKSRILAEAPENQEFRRNLEIVSRRMEVCWNEYLQLRSGGQMAGFSVPAELHTWHRINEELSAVRRMVSQMLELLDQRKKSLTFGKHEYLGIGQPNPSGPPGGSGTKFQYEGSPSSSTASSYFAPVGVQFPTSAGPPFQHQSPFSSSVAGFTPASASSVSSRTDITYGSTGGSSFTGTGSFLPHPHYYRQ